MDKHVFIIIVGLAIALIFVGSVSGAWCNSDYAKRINVSVNNTAGSALTDYQAYVNLSSNPINETSLRVYNATSCTLRPHWTENETGGNSYGVWINYSSIAASAWTNNTAIYYDNAAVSSASNGTNTFEFFDDFEVISTPADYYKFSVSSANHTNYGLSYPITYKFTIPSGSSNLKAYKKFTAGGSWVQIAEKTTNDFFNGIKAVRFDYTNNFAYVSIAFNASYEDIYLKVVNASDSPVGTYSEITSYYDNRKCAATCSIDEWDDCGESYACGLISKFGDGARLACDECTLRHLWLSVGIVTKGRNNGGEPTWADMQTKIDAGYIEPVSHSRTHADAEGTFDAESEVGGSKSDIINNLSLPALNKKGSTEYVFAYLEPYGHSSAACRQKLGEHDYLCDRDVTIDDAFASWDSGNGLYNRIGYSVRMGIDGTTTVSTLNSEFDDCYNNGKIYHLMWHSAQETTAGCWGVDYTAGSYFHQHLDYIKDKKDVWYVAFGHLYQYHYVKERNIVTATSSGGSEGDTSKWTDTPAHGNKSIVISPVKKGSGAMKLEDTSSTNYKVWRNLTARTKYAFHWYARLAQTDAGQLMDVFQNDTQGVSLVFVLSKIQYYDGSYHPILDPYVADTWYHFEVHADADADKFDLWLDGLKKVTEGNFNNGLTTINKFMFRGYSPDMPTVYIDDFFVRKYASPEPSATLGSEEQQGTNPTLHIGNAINIKEDWGRNFNSNRSANVTTANASEVYMNFSNAEFTNASLGNLNLSIDEWVNESHNVNVPVTNVSVDVTLNSTTSGATNDTNSFWYEITKRTNTATMDSAATQNVDTSETFYVNATCNEEHGDSFLGAANLLEDGAIIDTNSSVTNYVNFSHSESSAGQYNYTVRFYNLTHYDNVTTPTYSNVTVFDVVYEPPDPTNLQNVTGNFWVNHTWSPGSGNITNSYNVSIHPIWFNTTLTAYYNDTGLTPHDWSNITVLAYNTSGNGSISAGSISDNVQIPNNLIGLTVTQNHNKLETQTVFISDTASSDTDGDTPTYSCNRTDLFADFSTVTGHGNWTTLTTDAGTYYVDIGVSDGWGSTDNKTLTVVITDATPTAPTNLQNTTGNFWANHTWDIGTNTDSFNVSVFPGWYNTTTNAYWNDTGLIPHDWSNATIYGFNSTSSELSGGTLQNTQIPNNAPVLSGLPDNTTDEDVNQTDIFDLDDYFTDVDGDTPTFLVEANNQSAYVTVVINASNNVSYTLASGWNGTAEVVINATDGWGGEDNDTFLIIVNAAPLPGDYTPGDPTTLQNTTGNYWVNYTWNVGGGNVTDSYNVSWNATWYNTTLTEYMQKEVGVSNWGNISVYAYNSSGNGSLSAGYITDNVQAPAYAPGDYPPATPTTLANTTGNGWVHYTWSSGGGANITDSYNVSWNLSWYNNTLVAYMNDTVGEFGWANISVYAFNSSGNGSLSAGSISDNTQADGGTFTTSMGTTAYNLITYYGSATSTAEQFGLDIGSVDYIAMYNGSFHTHTMGFSANNFTTYHGIGYYVYLNASGSSTYQRNNIPEVPYNTQLYNRWNTIGWTNATNTNAEGIANSIGSACKYTSMLNADGVTYTTHTVGFTSNNHAVEKGKGYWVWVNTGLSWSRNS